MSQLVVKCNTKSYRLERLNDFYLRVCGDDISEQVCVLTDLDFVWIGFNDAFCASCFYHRYLCFAHGIYLEDEIDPPVLEGKNWKNVSYDEVLGNIEELCTVLQDNELPGWCVYDVSNGEQFHIDMHPYESCAHCFLRRVVTADAAQPPTQREVDVATQETLSDLVEFLDSSFGLVACMERFSGEDIGYPFIGDRHLASILTTYPSEDGDRLKNCGALDTDSDRAHTRALMEFVERYAFIQGYPLQVVENPPDNMKADGVSSSYHGPWVFGWEWFTGETRLLPATHMYREVAREYNATLPSTSGMAAHLTKEQAQQSALMECLERDAVMRWWLDPLTAEPIKVSDKLHAQLNECVDTLRRETGNESIEWRIWQIPSPLEVPVALAGIFSGDSDKGPAFLLSAHADFSCDRAAQKATEELLVLSLNYLLWVSGQPRKKTFADDYSDVKTAEDHMRLYYEPEMRKKLSFLDELKTKKAGSAKEGRVLNIDELKEMMLERDWKVYFCDQTPQIFQSFGVWVIRCFVPRAYPLYFGFPLPFYKEPRSNASCVDRIPHPFA